jgi:hypothetical protein
MCRNGERRCNTGNGHDVMMRADLASVACMTQRRSQQQLRVGSSTPSTVGAIGPWIGARARRRSGVRCSLDGSAPATRRQSRALAASWTLRAVSIAAAVVLASGCYHYSFEQRQPAPGETLTRHTIRAATWINGFVGTGRVDTAQYCAHPVRTELQVRASDVLLSLVTLLIYTPHTLYVTCGA